MRPDVVEPQRPREIQRPGRPAEQVDVHAIGPREHGRQQADRARADDEHPLAGLDAGATYRAEGVPSGFHHRAHRVVHRVRQSAQRDDRDRDLLSEPAGTVAADADLAQLGADVVSPGQAAPAHAASEHRVGRDPATDPGRIDPLPDGVDDPRPLVSDADRIRLPTVVEVRHPAGIELEVRTAHPAACDAHDDVARYRFGSGDIADAGRARTADDEGSHRDGTYRIAASVNGLTILAPFGVAGRTAEA